MLLTQLIFKTQKKRRSRSAVTLPVSRALRRAVASIGRCCIGSAAHGAAAIVKQYPAAAMLLTQLFFKTQKIWRSRSAVTLPVSRALRQAVGDESCLRRCRNHGQVGAQTNVVKGVVIHLLQHVIIGTCIQQVFSMIFTLPLKITLSP